MNSRELTQLTELLDKFFDRYCSPENINPRISIILDTLQKDKEMNFRGFSNKKKD